MKNPNCIADLPEDERSIIAKFRILKEEERQEILSYLTESVTEKNLSDKRGF